ncbi:MAG: hypothetical protein R2857_00505 [Vampirovibrionales bacterium]
MPIFRIQPCRDHGGRGGGTAPEKRGPENSSKTDANKQQQGHTLDTIKNALVEGLPHQIEEKQFERFDPLHLYQFVYDADLDQIHLLDMHTGKMLTLSAQDFQAVADNLVNAYGKSMTGSRHLDTDTLFPPLRHLPAIDTPLSPPISR